MQEVALESSRARWRLSLAALLGVFPLFAVGLPVLSAAGCRSHTRACVYQRDNENGFLTIERIPADGRVGFGPIKVETSRGAKQLREVLGDCAFVLDEIAGARGAPVVVETRDTSYYRVVYDANDSGTVPLVEVADKLGLEIVHEQKRKLAFVVRANDEKPTAIERFQGQPKWPEAREPRKPNALGLPELTYGRLTPREIRRFPHGGILFIRQKFDDDSSIADDDNLYFDGVSFDELANYFGEVRRFPVVNQTKDHILYSFTLPHRIEKQFSFGKSVALPGLGLSVTSDEVEMTVILIRDKQLGEVAKRSSG